MTISNDRFSGLATPKIAGAEPIGKANVSAMANAASDQLAEVAGQAQQIARIQLDNLADAIRRKPIQATGIAAGVGFLLALLARR